MLMNSSKKRIGLSGCVTSGEDGGTLARGSAGTTAPENGDAKHDMCCILGLEADPHAFQSGMEGSDCNLLSMPSLWAPGDLVAPRNGTISLVSAAVLVCRSTSAAMSLASVILTSSVTSISDNLGVPPDGRSGVLGAQVAVCGSLTSRP